MFIQTFEDEILIKNYLYQNDEVKIIFVDSPGQNEFTPFLQNKYFIGKSLYIISLLNNKGVNAYLLVYSIADSNSFDVIQHINSILLNSVGAKYVPRIIVGNMTDLEENRY